MVKSHPLCILPKKLRDIFFMNWLQKLVDIEARFYFFFGQVELDSCEAMALISAMNITLLGIFCF
jgi:hypothetical protein